MRVCVRAKENYRSALLDDPQRASQPGRDGEGVEEGGDFMVAGVRVLCMVLCSTRGRAPSRFFPHIVRLSKLRA